MRTRRSPARSRLHRRSRFRRTAPQIQISASIGLAELERGENEEAVLRRADVALYAAKGAGRNGFAWFDQELEVELSDRLCSKRTSAAASARRVHSFLPAADRSRTGRSSGSRCSPGGGRRAAVLEAEFFIDAAERTGLIGPLTFSVMEQAIKEARYWPANLKIAVNVSPVQFRDPTLAEQILKLLASTGFPAQPARDRDYGSLAARGSRAGADIIESLKNVGVSISLDDFGTGYASLAQVNRLPLDRIKIDKSFITTIVKSQQTAAIVNTIAGSGPHSQRSHQRRGRRIRTDPKRAGKIRLL